MSKNVKSSYDVIVVGSGAAGCTAAISAHLNGAKTVLVCEKSERMVGGTTRLAGGGWIWVPNNPFLRKVGVRESTESIVKLMKSWSGWTNDANDEELMYAFAREAPVAIQDLMKRGIYVCNPVELRSEEDREKVRTLIRSKLKSNPDLCFRAGVTEKNVEALCGMMPSYCCEDKNDPVPVGKVLQPTGKGGGTSQQLSRAARKCQGVEIHKGCAVTGLLVGQDKREIRGVRLKSGKQVQARKGVIFASGGFASNPSLIRKNFGERSIRGTCAAPTNTGDFVKILSRDLGMSSEKMKLSRAWVKQTVLPFSRKRSGVFFLNADSAFVVDRTGNRFQNEKHHYQERGNYMLDHLNTHRLVFFVFDSRARDMYAGPIRGLGGPIPMLGEGKDCIVSGNTIQELSRNLRKHLLKIDDSFTLTNDFESQLELTTTRFNRYARTGIDPEFRRGENAGDYTWHLVGRAEDNKYPNKTMFPLEPTYHCLVLGVSLLDTKSGPRIDKKARVLDERGIPIPKLFGAGNCVHSSSNRSYWSAGCTISHAMTFGYVAGRECVLGGSKI